MMHVGDIMMHVGDIMMLLEYQGGVQCRGDIMSTVRGYSVPWGIS